MKLQFLSRLDGFWALRLLIFPLIINVPDGTFRENHGGTDEKLSGLLMSERSRGTDQWLWDEDLTSGLGSLGYSSITPPVLESPVWSKHLGTVGAGVKSVPDG